MIEAQSAAMLVKAHALTQSATAELFRIRRSIWRIPERA